jgi:predicted MFS family arabinose efflux permease
LREGNRPAKPISTRALLADRKVIVIALAAALAYAPMVAIMSQSQPLLVEQGLSQGTAAMLVGLFGVTSIVGALVTGLLLDRYWAPAVAMGVLSLGATGALILASGQGTLLAASLGVLLIGFTLGAEIDICAFVVARYCGIANYASVYGITVFAIASASGVGSTAIGYIYDHAGTYGPALVVCAAAFVLSGLTYLSLGRYPDAGEA